jgi:hypothetical protein
MLSFSRRAKVPGSIPGEERLPRRQTLLCREFGQRRSGAAASASAWPQLNFLVERVSLPKDSPASFTCHLERNHVSRVFAGDRVSSGDLGGYSVPIPLEKQKTAG